MISACFPATTSSELQVITRHVGIQMKRLKVVDFIRSSEVFNGGMVGKWWEYQHDGDIDGIFGYTFGEWLELDTRRCLSFKRLANSPRWASQWERHWSQRMLFRQASFGYDEILKPDFCHWEWSLTGWSVSDLTTAGCFHRIFFDFGAKGILPYLLQSGIVTSLMIWHRQQ